MCAFLYVSHSDPRGNVIPGIAETAGSNSQAHSQSSNNKKRFYVKEKDFCDVHLPVVVSADAPDTDATDWLGVEQAAIVWVNQGQHAVLKHQQHPFTLSDHKQGYTIAVVHNLEGQDD